MNRKSFIKTMSIFTITMPFLNSCAEEETKRLAPEGAYKVVDELCTSCLKCVAMCPEIDRQVIVQDVDTVVIHQNLCVECGDCYEICPYEAIVTDDRKLDSSEILHIIEDDCIGCKLCENVCPTNAIIVTSGKANINQEECVHCNKCVEVCETQGIITGDIPRDPYLDFHVKASKCTSCEACIPYCVENAITIVNSKAFIDNEKCTQCGVCETACPEDAIYQGVYEEDRDPCLDYHVKASRCDACDDCISECPENAIAIVNGKAVINNEVCTQCGLCETVCSQDAIYQGDEVPTMYYVSSCRGCRRCVASCPSDAISMVSGDALIDQDLCTQCGICVSKCPWGLIKAI